MEVRVDVGRVMDQGGSVCVWILGSVVDAFAQSDRNDIIYPKEVSDKIV